MADKGMKGSPVLVVGDSMLDCYWQGHVDRISLEAPVPVLCFEREWLHAGGAANVAANLVALGGTATLATLLGEDDAAQQLSTLVEEAGVRLRAVHSADMVTTKKIRAVCSHHQLLRVDIERPASEDDAKTLCELVCGLLPTHRWVVLSDYHKGALSHCPNMWAAAGLVDTDLSFLSLLELYGTEISERRMPTRRVVEALDVIEHI